MIDKQLLQQWSRYNRFIQKENEHRRQLNCERIDRAGSMDRPYLSPMLEKSFEGFMDWLAEQNVKKIKVKTK